MENQTDNNEAVQQLQQVLDNATAQLNQARQLLAELGALPTSSSVHAKAQELGQDFYGNTQIVEGVFNGQNMVGPDGKIYTVPANYASKSKLVEGDILKLTIRPDGSFVYKQIGPVERKRIVGTLVYNKETTDFSVLIGNRSYKVIKASVTYYKGEPGDEVVLLVPQDEDSVWGAVENVINQGEGVGDYLDDSNELDNLDDLVDGFKDLELPPGDEAELPPGPEAELPPGDEAELPS